MNLDPKRNATTHRTDSTQYIGLGFNEIDIASSTWADYLKNNPIQVFFATCSSATDAKAPCTESTYSTNLNQLQTIMKTYPLTQNVPFVLLDINQLVKTTADKNNTRDMNARPFMCPIQGPATRAD